MYSTTKHLDQEYDQANARRSQAIKNNKRLAYRGSHNEDENDYDNNELINCSLNVDEEDDSFEGSDSFKNVKATPPLSEKTNRQPARGISRALELAESPQGILKKRNPTLLNGPSNYSISRSDNDEPVGQTIDPQANAIISKQNKSWSAKPRQETKEEPKQSRNKPKSKEQNYEAIIRTQQMNLLKNETKRLPADIMSNPEYEIIEVSRESPLPNRNNDSPMALTVMNTATHMYCIETTIPNFDRRCNYKALLDSGSSVTAIHYDLFRQLPNHIYTHKPYDGILQTANKERLKSHGRITIEMELGKGIRVLLDCIVVENLATNILIGSDLLYSEFVIGPNNRTKKLLLSNGKSIQLEILSAETLGIIRGSQWHSIGIIQSPESQITCHLISMIRESSTEEPDDLKLTEKGENNLNQKIELTKNFTEKSITPELDSKPSSGPKPKEDDPIDIFKETKIGDNPDLTDEQRKTLRKLITDNRECFSTSEYETGRTHLFKYDIKLKKGISHRKPNPRWMNPNQQEIVDQIISEWIAKKFIVRVDPNSNQSALWISPLVLARKKGQVSWRLCVDYRLLNEVTVDEVCILPHTNKIMAKLGAATIFSTVDLSQGYMNVELTDSSIPLTGFSNGSDIFVFNVLPFGLKSAPSQFQAFMDSVFKELIDSSIIAFIDDLIIYNSTFEEHLKSLSFVFSKLKYANLRLKPRKCEFGSREVHFLGHIVSKDGVHTDPDKVKAMQKMPRPTDVTELQQFLGFVNFYRKFLPRLSETQIPLYGLLKKDIEFRWTEQQEQAFIATKNLLTSNQLLGHPDWSKTFYLSTDASLKAAAAVLEQFEQNFKRARPLAYWSKAFNRTQRNYSASDRELFALFHGIKNFRSYLLGAKFVVFTDCQALTYILCNKLTNPKWIRTSLKLAEFNFKIVYKPGVQNVPADTLSRLIETENDEADQHLVSIIKTLRRNQEYNSITTVTRSKARELRASQTLSDEEVEQKYRATEYPSEADTDSDEDAFADQSPLNWNSENSESDDESTQDQNKSDKPPKRNAETNSDENPTNSKRVHWDSTLSHQDFDDSDELENTSDSDDTAFKPLEQQTQTVVYVPDFEESEISVHNFSILQQKDKNLTKWIAKAKPGTHPKFLIEDSLLKVTLEHQVLTVVPECLERQIIISCHQGIITSNHLGVTGTIKRILEKYYIVHIVAKVRAVIRTCATCQRIKRDYDNTDIPMLRQPLVTQPLSKVATDFIGPFKQSGSGNRYILSVIDIHSRYLVLIPTIDQKAHTFIDQFVTQWISHFGVPDILLSDNGPAFTAKTAKAFYKLYGIKKNFSLPLRPQSNGIVERSNQSVVQQLRAATSKKKTQQWDKKLPTIQFDINNTVSNATGYKPSQLIFGIHIKAPYHMLIDNPEKQPKTLNDACNEWYNDLIELRKQTVKHQIRQQNSYLSTKEGSGITKFRAGQLVCLYRKPEHKLQAGWLGPYTIEAINGNSATIRARNLDNAPLRKIHTDQLKHYYTINNDGEDLVIEDPALPTEDLIDFTHNTDNDREHDSSSGSDEDEKDLKEEEYIVKKILKKRTYNRKIQYLVWWKNYSIEDASWEFIENLDNCQQLIEEFEKTQDKRNKPSQGQNNSVRLIY